jgi:lipoprotein-anchoring transpeptidase ErfK/SrfK
MSSRLRRLVLEPAAAQADALVDQAREALSRGRRAEARRALWAALAADPHSSRAWLMLAALASPQASLSYARRALELRPNSPVARSAVEWAEGRVREQGARLRTQDLRLSPDEAGVAGTEDATRQTQPLSPASTLPPLHPSTRPALPEAAPTIPMKAVRPEGRPGRSALVLVLLALLASGLVAAYAFGGRFAAPERQAAVAYSALDDYQKATDAPAPTDTPTVTPSPTITPTFTPTPTSTPTPVDTPTPPPFQVGGGNGEARWIDVNLSQQVLTAMEGDVPVQTFLVSTGLWNTPTVTGQFRVYVMYPAADMSGPGYYLPQVPYVMYFHGDYGIHGTYWHNNFGNPMSHGCVNMRTEEAGWLFEWSSVGTLVNVHY